MSKGIGRLFQLGIAKEAVRGTAASASAAFWIPFSEVTIDEKSEKVVQDQSMGVIEDSVGQDIVKQWAEGKFKAPLGDASTPLILYSLLGTKGVGAHAGETIVYDHTLTVAQNSQHQSLTVFLDDPISGVDYKHALSVFKSLEINVVTGKAIELSGDILTQKGASGALTPAYVAENRFVPQHAIVKIAANQAGLDAASAINVLSANIKIDQNIEEEQTLGNITPTDFLNKQFSIEGTLELVWQDETYKTLSLAATAKALRIDLINSDVTIGSSAHPEIKIDLHKVVLTELTRPVKINDIVKQTITFKAHYSTTDSKMVTIVATNKIASY